MNTIKTNKKDFETITELARRIGSPRGTVANWVKDSKLKTRRCGAVHRIYPDHWEEFLRRCNNGELVTFVASA